jgi:ABC-type Fe3+-hydroxamate transport system substrate-binding protein
MHKPILSGIVAAVLITASIGAAFATSMNNVTEPAIQEFQDKSRVIKHAMGETEITGTPQRIVALQWDTVEHLLALGVQPVGAADIETMETWVNMKNLSLADNVVDVGLRWEPNLELVSQLEPDLIIGDVGGNGPMYEELSEIAPTIILNPNPTQEENVGQLERMEQYFMMIADVVGRHDQGVAVLNRMHQKFEEGAAAVNASEAAGKPFVLVQTGAYEDDALFRIWTQNGMAAEIIAKFGMQNAWPVEYSQWGYSDIGLEDLGSVEDANFFYIAGGESDPFETTYKDNPVWKNLKFVQEGRVYPIGGDTWTFGGPISAEVIVEKVVAAITDEQSGARTITHAMGETEITGTPKRIVALQWNYVEDLLAVGVQPVGVADIQTMKKFVSLGNLSLSEDVVDVGQRYEPNLEVIAQLEPDLIIGDYSGNGKTYGELSAIAPTILFDPYPAQDNGVSRMEEMEQTFMTIANITGRHEQGVAVLTRMNQTLDEAKSAVQASEAAGKPFVLVMTGSYKDDYTKFRIWTQNARAAEIIEKIGMENAWNVNFTQYGYSEIGLEHLVPVQDANFFYVAGGGHDPFETTLYTGNPVWNNLKFVQEGRVYPLGGDTWLYGGPISAEILANKVVKAVTS